MATYQDINAFDWSSIIPSQPQAAQPQPVPQQVKLNNNDEEWFNRFLVSGQQTQASSTNVTNTTVNTASTSPLEFSSLFDIQDREYDEESLFSNSNLTSVDNSPIIKAEEFSQSLFIPKLDLDSNNFQLQQIPTAERNFSVCSSDLSESEQAALATTSATTAAGSADTKKPKKKRAPRKRLTPHQKQAHNKIEKRYRININAKIAGLQQIIPWVSNEKTAFETGEGSSNLDSAAAANDDAVPKLNKSMILEKATSYILHLQENERIMNDKLALLKSKVMELGGDVSQF
ncbi:hypothetical protein WICPIJ_003605 [Wickerhamomyces pijperi]|uniref:BHLH domain-containing protein n=1 Tax=Wickerhamomyces pijperi TaxID=599730 RepID=A0A9P8Q9I6_WICPI|nr:hypothetical protein WICPIJ_003605 [Wickerhamomyces pijperi]